MFLSICQRYNMKANHNYGKQRIWVVRVFINMSKIQYESKSQPGKRVNGAVLSFYQYVKDTI